MDWTTLINALLSTQAPWLPTPDALRWGLRLGWGIVLALLMLWLARRWSRRVQLGLAGGMVVWNLLPGPWSPAYWLGLALQAPSLMTVGLGLWLGERQLRADGPFPPGQRRTLWGAAAVGGAWGWVLLLDTFAVWPVSVYAAGFSPVVVLLLAVAAGLPWMISGDKPGVGKASLFLGAVLLSYVLLRLPTGNVWDALLDPLLWLSLQLAWLWRGLCRFMGWWRVSTATRA